MATVSNGGGVVGLGRNLFQPTCCYACLSSFWSLLLPCSQVDPRAFSNTSPQCHASNTAYLSSLAYCMEQKCGADNVSTSLIEQCWNRVAGDGLHVSSFNSSLPLVAPTSELAYDATTLGGTSMLVNASYYLDTRDTLLAYAGQERDHALYSTILILVVVGICILLGIEQFKQWIAPRLPILPRSISAFLKRYLALPAMFGQRHIRKLPGSIGYVPQRSAVLLITLYIALNVAFCAISYSASPNNTWFVASNKEFLAYIANRTGVLSLANIALTIIFSSRNTPLLYLTRLSRTDLTTFHRWAGRIAALEGIIHGAIYWSTTNSVGSKMFTAAAGISYLGCSNIYWDFGIIAIIIFIMIAVFSILPIRTYLYEAFLFLHIVLVVVALVALWYHLVDRYSRGYGYEVWLCIAFALWGFDRIMRVVRLIILNFRILYSRQPTAKVELLPGNEFLRVTVWPSVNWQVKAGQYCFLYFCTLPLYLESHPFTIVSWSTRSRDTFNTTHLVAGTAHANTGSNIEMLTVGDTTDRKKASSITQAAAKPSVSFIIRPIAGATLRLHSLLLKQPSSSAISIPVLMEGPYGFGSPAVSSADSILAIAGGIGITATLGYLSWYISSFEPSRPEGGKKGGIRAKQFILVWVVRELSLVEAISSQLPSSMVLEEHNIDIIISCGERGDTRIDWKEKVENEVDGLKENERMAVVCCAAGVIADEIRARVVAVQRATRRVDLVEEVFAW